MAHFSNTIIQVIVGDGELIRHGPLLPTMMITIPSGSYGGITEVSHTFRSPIPGDIIIARHAKTYLGFTTCCYSSQLNSKHGDLGVNAIFLPNYVSMPNSEDIISMQKRIFEMCRSSPNPSASSLQELLSPFELYGVGCNSDETTSSGYPFLQSTDQSPTHIFNQTLITASTNSGTVSVWVPPLQTRFCNQNNSTQLTEGEEPLYELLGVFALVGYSYMPRKNVSSCIHRSDTPNASMTGKIYCFMFEPLTLKHHTNVAFSIPNDTYPEVISYYTHLKPTPETQTHFPDTPSLDLIQRTPHPSHEVSTSCRSIESLCSSRFFSHAPPIPLSPPLYRHLHAAEFVSQIVDTTLRRKVSLSLLQMITTLQVPAGESIFDAFTKSLTGIRVYYEENHPTLCSVLGDCLFHSELLFSLKTTIFPGCVMTACSTNEDTNLFITQQCGGTIRQMSDVAMRGLQYLSQSAMASLPSKDHLYTVRHGGKLIHYHPFGDKDGTNLDEWNNLQDVCLNNSHVASFVEEMTSAVSSVASNPSLQFKYFANHMANFLPHGEEHPEPQDPHCDTSDTFRRPWIDNVTGKADVFTVFAPASEDGAMICIWPIHCGHTCPLDSSLMKIVFIPHGHLLVLNGAVFHAGGLCFGKAKQGSFGPFISMQNLRLQAFFIPEQFPKPCNVDQTLLIVKKDVKQSFSYSALQHIKFYLLEGNLTNYSTVHDVKVFRNKFVS
jgi:hypothetical protein